MPPSQAFEWTAEERWMADRLPACCADCGVTTEDGADLAEFPRHGDNVLLCPTCYGEARANLPEEYRDGS